MSRSYKKHPFGGYCKTDKTAKKRFNKTVRRKLKDEEDLPSKGNFHKKMNETWEICDGNQMFTVNDALKCWDARYENEENIVNAYNKDWISK